MESQDGLFFPPVINKYLCQEKTVSYLQKLKGKNKKSLSGLNYLLMKHYKADSILFWWYVLRDNAKLNNKNY